jgi:hypothetical protein
MHSQSENPSLEARLLSAPFDPSQGVTVLEPPGTGAGWWVGACSALYDEEANAFYLYYRIRKPRELGRGVECRIAVSRDGRSFTDIWSATKQELNTPSMERACLVKVKSDLWRLYIGMVDPEDGRWRTDAMEAPSPDAFNPKERWTVFTAEDVNVEGVKDPWVIQLGGRYLMFLSYAPSLPEPDPVLEAMMHATQDVYNTGITRSHTALAESTDGRSFRWIGDVLSPSEQGWDAYAARISCVVPIGGRFVAYYDGSASVAENYEEKTGIAVSEDLRRFTRITIDGPALTSPYGYESLRYMDVVQLERSLYFYYEYSRPDGSHELRLSVVEW